jgi:hypothetical protein
VNYLLVQEGQVANMKVMIFLLLFLEFYNSEKNSVAVLDPDPYGSAVNLSPGSGSGYTMRI